MVIVTGAHLHGEWSVVVFEKRQAVVVVPRGCTGCLSAASLLAGFCHQLALGWVNDPSLPCPIKEFGFPLLKAVTELVVYIGYVSLFSPSKKYMVIPIF